MAPRYPFVLFDVGETLVGPHESYGAVYARVLGDLGLPVGTDRMERAIRGVAAALASRIPPGSDRFSQFPGGEGEFWSRFATRAVRAAVGRTPERTFTRDLLGRLSEAFLEPSAWRIYPDVVPTLEALRSGGCRLGVVSNWDSRLPRLLDVLGLSRYFEVLGVSHLEGIEKPDPALFHRVLERLGARPEQALHVGNLAEVDLAGARAAGLDGLLVDRTEAGPAPGFLRDLWGLPRIVLGSTPQQDRL